MSLSDRWRLALDRLRRDGRHRVLQAPAGIDFSSNDYLGYSKRSWPACEFARSGAASRLLRGHHPIWDEVETRLAQWHGAEAALMLTSGYAANEGLLSTIVEPADTVFSDQCNHASIIDGLRLSKAEKIVYPHNDVDELKRMMRRHAHRRLASAAWFVVTESLFGMDGDRAPLQELAELSERYGAHLIVDEAHATGCFGPSGSGIVDALGLRGRVLATVHTGGKALGVPGAYVAGSRLLKETLVNRCRHFMFTTALPPLIGAWWLDMLAVVRDDDASRQALRQNAESFRAELAARQVAAGGTDDYIVPIVLGEDAAALEAAVKLQEAGFDVRAIRPPTVAPDTARLRISIHADHHTSALRDLSQALVASV